jgi:flagellar basal-body rod modification protein FlgD
MSAITATNPLLAAASNASTTSSSNTSSSGTTQAQQQESQFLQLLVTQLKEQNPLDPTDGTTFVTQLAQFSSLNELVGINSTLKSFAQAPASTSGPSLNPGVNPFQATPAGSSSTNNSTQGA